MADLNITSQGLGIKFADGRNGTTFTINEFSVRKNADGDGKVHVVSDLKDNYAEYVIVFDAYDNVYYNGVVVSTLEDLFSTLEGISATNVGLIANGGEVTVQNPLPVQIQGIKPNGDFSTVNANILGNLLVSLDEQKDAFGRLKTAEPYTEWDSAITSELADTLFWSELINGTGSSVYDRNTSKKTISVSVNGDYVVRQTKQRFKYQPFKSLEWAITGLLTTETGVRKRVGLLDYDNIGLATIANTPQNGVFFENNEGVFSWNIVNNGVITETATQAQWNIDSSDGNGRSGFNFQDSSANIWTCQLEWLGVGVVLVGFAVGAGSIIYCHAFQHASQSGFVDVYMRTANLPVSYEITSTGGAGSLKAICSSVVSGGGFNPRGLTTAVFNPSAVSISNGDTELLCGVRMKEDSFEYTIDADSISILSESNGNTTWFLSINPTYTGTVSWGDKPNTEIQQAFNNGNEVTDQGVIIEAGHFSNNADSITTAIKTALRIGKDLLGNRDEMWLCVTALGNENYRGAINLTELI